MMTFVMISKEGECSTSLFLEKEMQKNRSAYNHAIWVEIVNPTLKEREFIQQQDNIDLPDHHELHQIEFSNQFYLENDNIYLTTNLVTISYPRPETHAANIIVTKKKFITIRYSDPNPIEAFLYKIKGKIPNVQTHYGLLLSLIQSFIGKNADIFEVAGERSNYLSVFLSGSIKNRSVKKREHRLNKTLQEINTLEGLISMAYQSLSSLIMLVNYLEQYVEPSYIDVKIIKQDIAVLLKHGDYLNQKIVFQLDTTLGAINIEQMGIVKIFTVLAMVFMPPTLIASMYGMNFKHMPELESVFSYPLVLVAMALSAYLPWIIFRKKGWI